MDENLKRCQDRFGELLRAAYNETKPIDRELAKGAAECGAYLLDRITRPDAHCEPRHEGEDMCPPQAS